MKKIDENSKTKNTESPNKTSESPNPTRSFRSLIQAPGNIPPSYTTQTRLKKLEGQGELMYFVTKQGHVTDVTLTTSTGHPELDSIAINAFSKYKFLKGQEGWTTHPFKFILKGPTQKYDPDLN